MYCIYVYNFSYFFLGLMESNQLPPSSSLTASVHVLVFPQDLLSASFHLSNIYFPVSPLHDSETPQSGPIGFIPKLSTKLSPTDVLFPDPVHLHKKKKLNILTSATSGSASCLIIGNTVSQLDNICLCSIFSFTLC